MWLSFVISDKKHMAFVSFLTGKFVGSPDLVCRSSKLRKHAIIPDSSSSYSIPKLHVCIRQLESDKELPANSLMYPDTVC